MTRHILMLIPLYIMAIYNIYNTFKNYRGQTEWNSIKKWNLVGCIFFILGLFLFIYQDFIE